MTNTKPDKPEGHSSERHSNEQLKGNLGQTVHEQGHGNALRDYRIAQTQRSEASSARIREFCWVEDRVHIMVVTISRHSRFAYAYPYVS